MCFAFVHCTNLIGMALHALLFFEKARTRDAGSRLAVLHVLRDSN
jgi:hypothetical protein